MSHVISLELSLSRPASVVPSARVMGVAAMFGLGLDERREVAVVSPLKLTLTAGAVVFITGSSGGGKSTLLRLIASGIEAEYAHEAGVIWFDQLPAPPEVSLVDALGDAPLDCVLRWLSVAGLNDAFVMLRKPSELSDGQRYRFRLAQVLSTVERREDDGRLLVVLADEFGATLDRQTAGVIGRNVRRWMRRRAGSRVCFVAATSHDDLLEALEPDVLIEKQAGSGHAMVDRRGGAS